MFNLISIIIGIRPSKNIVVDCLMNEWSFAGFFKTFEIQELLFEIQLYGTT